MLTAIGVAIGIVAGAALALLAVQAFGATGVGKARRMRRQLLEDAQREADALRREAQIGSREVAVMTTGSPMRPESTLFFASMYPASNRR